MDSGVIPTVARQTAQMTRPNLPNFLKPPVSEVALSVQFEELAGLGIPQIGLLWRGFRERFPVTEQHALLPPAFEVFGVRATPEVAIGFEMMQSPPLPRCWFLNEQRTELIQVQTNRFIHNWRKVGSGDEYPRYEHLRNRFEQELHEFQTFLEQEGLGVLAPNQCEVTYVNQILADQGWSSHGEIGNVLTVFQPQYSDDYLRDPEDVRLQLRFLLKDPEGNPIGRLHINAKPAYRRKDGLALLELTLTVRGNPRGDGIDGVFGFFDIGRETIVRAFASITTPAMHQLWERTQ